MEQLQRKLAWSKKQTSFAWAKYYDECRSQLAGDIEAYNQIEQLPPETPVWVS